MTMERKALVLGATGGVGGSVAATLLRHGWQVRGMARKPQMAQPGGIEWVLGDAMVREDVMRAAEGVSVIVHAVNPPGYQNWETLVLPMIDNTIAAARAVGARVLLPGTVYNFDPATTPVLSADSPQRPSSRKGKIRAAMEKRLEDAAPEVPALIVRAGDYFGPGARSSWFSQGMVTAGKPVKWIINPARGAGHSWAYLPDLAEAFARILEMQERLAPFERVQFGGVFDHDGKQMIGAIRKAIGRRVPVFAFPWWVIKAMAPFGGFAREAADIAPVWRNAMRFDNRRLIELIGAEPHTPLDEAMRASLVDLGSMPAVANISESRTAKI